MSLNQSLISDFSEYYRWSQRTKIKYKLHYGWCTGRPFYGRHTAQHQLQCCSEVKQKSEMRSFKSNENIHKKEGGWYYVVSANKASSVTLLSPGNESQRKTGLRPPVIYYWPFQGGASVVDDSNC